MIQNWGTTFSEAGLTLCFLLEFGLLGWDYFWQPHCVSHKTNQRPSKMFKWLFWFTE
jgi:hypothetical protein